MAHSVPFHRIEDYQLKLPVVWSDRAVTPRAIRVPRDCGIGEIGSYIAMHKVLHLCSSPSSTILPLRSRPAQ
jgi:hypothetical protein